MLRLDICKRFSKHNNLALFESYFVMQVNYNNKKRRVIRGFHIQDLSYTLCNVVRDTYSSLIIFVNYSPGL